MKRITSAGVLSAFLAMAMFVACAGEPGLSPEPRLGALSGPRIALALEPGAHYAKDARFLWLKYTVWPQVAVWLEKPDGTYVDTIYVTEIAVTGKYKAAPGRGRPEALPVWSRLRKGAVDAVSSPTTVGAAVTYGNTIAARLPAGDYVVKLETNRSYDWNEVYTKKNSGVNGQPSVVYQAGLALGGSRTTAALKPVGTGSVDGMDGDIRPDLAGIDTALQLFSSMTVSYEPD